MYDTPLDTKHFVLDTTAALLYLCHDDAMMTILFCFFLGLTVSHFSFYTFVFFNNLFFEVQFDWFSFVDVPHGGLRDLFQKHFFFVALHPMQAVGQDCPPVSPAGRGVERKKR